MLLASVSLIIAGVLSFKTFIERLRVYMGIRDRRMRISRIPTIKYSSQLVIDQDKIRINDIEAPMNDADDERGTADDKNEDVSETKLNEDSSHSKDSETDYATMLSLIFLHSVLNCKCITVNT